MLSLEAVVAALVRPTITRLAVVVVLVDILPTL
jgi:hypothetical protein